MRLDVSRVALLSHLCMGCPTPLSLEVGFGMGSSATAILGTLALRGRRFEHLIFDPKGLSGGKGLVVADYLEREFRKRFQWLRQPSEIGLAKVLADRGDRCAGLIFIDGAHKFENVMTDFTLADRLCCEGGHIVFDDALYPAVETVLNYITANRPDYALHTCPWRTVPLCRRSAATGANGIPLRLSPSRTDAIGHHRSPVDRRDGLCRNPHAP
ncbi:MAG: class I SAM-dependent methyltransferase [Methyloceanibacter sp.]